MDDRESITKQKETKLSDGMPGDEMNPVIALPVETGRVLVLFARGETEAGAQVLSDAGGLSLSMGGESNDTEENKVYPNLGVAVISPDPGQFASISSASSENNSPILTMEKEQVIEVEPIVGVQQVEPTATWGLIETKVIDSQYSGAGIKVCILDTGVDLQHPDFKDRKITSQSFVQGEAVQDGHGHGTHCTGTACGPRNPSNSQRYGIAYAAEIYMGKVLNNKGSGTDGSIIEGIEWAIKNGCQIISMSIGGRVIVGGSYSQTYETAAFRALEQGTLIIAAAGNDSKRNLSPSIINPVSRPGNCPSIMSVAAIDHSFTIALFSNGEVNTSYKGGEVDIAGPGVNVYSSWPLTRKYNTINGTSMATPHVAGIAALFAEADPKARGRALWKRLIENVRPLQLTAREVGGGLVQAP